MNRVIIPRPFIRKFILYFLDDFNHASIGPLPPAKDIVHIA